MLKIAICDDIRVTVEEIDRFLQEYQGSRNQLLEVSKFYDAESLWEQLKHNHCDLIILDIELVKMNGVELGHLIRTELDDHTMGIVYISAMDTYYKFLFDVQPLNFLSKPIDKNKLFETLDLAIRLLDDQNHIFTFKDKDCSHRLRIKEILYFESFAHDLRVVTTNGTYIFRAAMSEVMNELADFGFIQVHRSYIVNYNQIKAIKYEEIIMNNNDSIPISRNKRKEIRDVLMRFGGEKL